MPLSPGARRGKLTHKANSYNFISHSLSLSLSSSEPIIFKARFVDWEDVLDVDFTQTPEILEKRAIERVGKISIIMKRMWHYGCLLHVYTFYRKRILELLLRKRQPRLTFHLCSYHESPTCPTEKL